MYVTAKNSPKKKMGQKKKKNPTLAKCFRKAVYMCADSFRQQWDKRVVGKKNLEALNSQHCFRITTLESTTYEHFPVWPHFPTLRA